MPPAFFLELAALLELQAWERQGLRHLLPAEVPTASQVKSDLIRRVQAGAASFATLDTPPICSCLVRTWLNHFSWSANDLLAANIVVDDINEDALVDAMARLLWNNRHLTANGNQQGMQNET